MAFWQAENLLHLFDEFVQYVAIHQAKQNQEGGTDRAANDSADCAEAIKFR